MVTVIIAAAGQGKRMGLESNKVFLPLRYKPVLYHSVMAMVACREVDDIVVVAADDEIQEMQDMLISWSIAKPWRVVAGGSERQYSIANALAAIPKETDIILVHDGARPFIDTDTIAELISAARRYYAAGVAVPVKDTIKRVDENGFISDTPPRNMLWAIQTPQAFRASLLRKAYVEAAQDGYLGTDDAALVERLGVSVKIVQGSYQNIKITTPEDLLIARAFMQKKAGKNMDRVGIGYDVHRLTEGRKLILGGVHIPYSQGLEGHSDADVLLHAVKDAILGAAAMGDIGRHFPDTDDRYKGESSLVKMDKEGELIAGRGYIVNNIDATIVAQKPKVAPFIAQMIVNIAETLEIKTEQVNVKATTTEGLGFAGRGEGIAAYASVSISKND